MVIRLYNNIKQEAILELKIFTKETFTLFIDKIHPIDKAIRNACACLLLTYSLDFELVKRRLESIRNSMNFITFPLEKLSETLNSVEKNSDKITDTQQKKEYLSDIREFLIDVCTSCTINIHKLLENVNELNEIELKRKLHEDFLNFEFFDELCN